MNIKLELEIRKFKETKSLQIRRTHIKYSYVPHKEKNKIKREKD